MTNSTFKQLGHDFASNKHNSRNLAIQLYAVDKEFHLVRNADVDNDIKAGMMVSYAENNPSINKTYALMDENYVEVDPNVKTKNEKITLSAGFIMAESQQSFGALKVKNPPLHALMLPRRQGIQKYVSGAFKDLIKMVKAVSLEGVITVRAPTKSFNVTVIDGFASLRKSCVNAKARGDVEADEKRFALAMLAFKKVWLFK